MSAEAAMLSLLKPLDGACTMTWMSTVSPRAPDKLIADIVPGSSVLPTRTSPDCTHTGNGGEMVASGDSLRSCASGAMKAFRVANTISTTAATIKPLNRQKVPCASCSFPKLNLVRMPMVLLLPRLVHGLDGSKGQGFNFPRLGLRRRKVQRGRFLQQDLQVGAILRLPDPLLLKIASNSLLSGDFELSNEVFISKQSCNRFAKRSCVAHRKKQACLAIRYQIYDPRRVRTYYWFAGSLRFQNDRGQSF